MKLALLYLSLICISTIIRGQEILFRSEMHLRSGYTDKRESFPVVNSVNNDLILFLLDNKELNGYLFDENFLIKDTIQAQRPENKFNTLLGSTADSNSYQLFYTTDKKNQFLVQDLDFNENTVKSSLFPFKAKNEFYLESINYNNALYFLTILKRSSILNLYQLTEQGVVHLSEFDLSEFDFSEVDYPNLTANLIDKNSQSVSREYDLEKIHAELINSIDQTSGKNKLYCLQGNIYITLDNELDNTKLIQINIEELSSSVRFIPQTSVQDDNRYNLQSNSFIFNEYLFQVKSSREEINFQISDLSTGEMLRKFDGKIEDGIGYAKSDFVQEGGTTYFQQNLTKEIENSKAACRKIVNSDIGISVYNSQSEFEVLIGGVKRIVGYYSQYPNPAYSPNMIGVSPTPSFHLGLNPAMVNYNSYTNTRSVYFKTLLHNSDYSVSEKHISRNAFERIKTFEKEHSSIEAPVIFKIEDYYIFGYYDKFNKEYYLRRF